MSQIRDSVGRVVTFDYSSPSQVRVTVNGKTWLYNLSPADSGGKKKLDSVVDPAGRAVTYAYQPASAPFRPGTEWASPGDRPVVEPGTNTYLNLVQVTHPTGGVSRYSYAEAHRDMDNDDPAVDNSSDLTYFRIAGREDSTGTAIFGQCSFSYYPYDPASQTVKAARQEQVSPQDSSGQPAREEWAYNRDHLLVSTKKISPAETATHIYRYTDDKVPSSEETRITSGGLVKSTTVNYTWNEYRDLLTRTDSLGRRVEFEYDLEYHLPTEKNELLSSGSVSMYRHTTYTLDSSKRNIVAEASFIGVPSEGPVGNYAGPSSPMMFGGSSWVWSPDKRIHSATIRTYWFCAGLWQKVTYQVNYRRAGELDWQTYATHTHSGGFLSRWGNCTITIPLAPGKYQFQVKVLYSGIWGTGTCVTSSEAQGRQIVWTPQGTTSRVEYSYDPSYPSNMTQVTFRHPDGTTEATGFTYDPAYHAYPATASTPVRKADGSTSTVTTFASYDAFGRVVEYGTRDGSSTTSNQYQYDAVGRLTRVTYPAVAGVVSHKTWAYDDVARTVTVTDENGHTLTERYDELGRFARLTRPLGGVTKTLAEVGYNSLGGIAFERDAEGHETRYAYDAFRRKLRVTYPDGAANAFEYGLIAQDPEGAMRYEKHIDSNGNWTKRCYDAAGRLVRVEELVSQATGEVAVTRYRYDLLDRVVEVRDAKDQVTTYTYDLFDSPTLADLPGTTEPAHAFTYDGRGRKIVEDANNPAIRITYQYDALGRLTRAGYADGRYAWFFYDKDSRLTEGRVYTQNGALESKTTSAYDARGRKTSESWQVNGVTYTLSYSYDPAGNMVSMTYPDGVSYQFVYDDWNRLVAIPGLFGENSVNPGFRYRDTGFLERIARANGITTVITPDVRMRPVSIQDSALTLSYTYDGEGNVRSQNGLAYAYDGLDRLISAQVPGASGGTRTVAYAYDKVGNRLSETWDGGAPKTYTYSPGNYLTQAGGMTYSYGAFGELRQKQASGTTTEYIYDGSRRMVQVKTGGTEVARYIYDALGRRISATSGGVTRVSLYLGNDIVYEAGGGTITKYVVAGGKYLAKVVTQAQAGAAGTLGAAAVVTPPVEPPDGSTSTSTSTKTPPGYIPPPDDRIIIIEPPIIYPPPPDEPPPGEEPPPQEPPPSEPQPPSSYGVFYFHTDLVGSIRAVTDSQGQVVARYEYEPFGLTVKAEGPLAGHDVHKFTGKPEDAATGLYYFGARYYDPEAGRFTSGDPARQGINWYVYCNNNPLRLVDPDGAFPRPAVLQHGIDIHYAIELDVRAKYPSFLMEVRWEFGGESGKVDLVDTYREEERVLEAYEIKSLTVRGLKEGAAQLAREMRGLAGSTGMRTVPGSKSLAGITSTDRHFVFYFSVPGTGLILYQAIDRERAGATLALAAIVGVAATVIEDIVTGGAGIVDDPLTVGACMALLGLEDQAGPVSGMTSGYYQGRYRVELD